MTPAARAASPSDAEIQRTLGEVLARPEYAHRKTDEQAWLDLFERVEKWLDGLQLWMFDLSVQAPLLYWILLLGLLGVALALLAHIVISVRAALRAPEPEAARAASASRRDLAAEAEALAARGSYLEASRRMHLACLEILLDRGLVDLRRGETNRKLRRELEKAPLSGLQRRTLGDLLGRLERQIFRDRFEDRALYEGWRGLHRELRTGAGTG